MLLEWGNKFGIECGWWVWGVCGREHTASWQFMLLRPFTKQSQPAQQTQGNLASSLRLEESLSRSLLCTQAALFRGESRHRQWKKMLDEKRDEKENWISQRFRFCDMGCKIEMPDKKEGVYWSRTHFKLESAEERSCFTSPTHVEGCGKAKTGQHQHNFSLFSSLALESLINVRNAR